MGRRYCLTKQTKQNLPRRELKGGWDGRWKTQTKIRPPLSILSLNMRGGGYVLQHIIYIIRLVLHVYQTSNKYEMFTKAEIVIF